jgi:hypothetical protein
VRLAAGNAENRWVGGCRRIWWSEAGHRRRRYAEGQEDERESLMADQVGVGV